MTTPSNASHALEDPQRWPAPARQAVEVFQRQFGQPHGPLTIAWASGRINLIGEHTDYNDGYVLPAPIDRVIALAGRATDADTTTLYSMQHQQGATFAASRPALAAAAPQSTPLWSRYLRGVLVELAALTTEPLTPAFDVAIVGDVPPGGGMSSSAALEVATATFARALGGPQLEPLRIAALCQRAEQRSTGANVGIMDQAASCLGRPGEAILLDCRSLTYDYVPFLLPNIVIAVYDTGVSHSHASSGYNERRRQCEEAVALLSAAIRERQPERQPERQVRSLRDISADDLIDYGATMPTVLLQRARHVISENARTLAAVAALRAGDLAELGALIDRSHVSLRDDYAVSCAELDATVEIAQSVDGVVGARMMGGGFGGSALILVRQEAQPALAATLAAEYPRRTGRAGTLHICHLAGGPQTRHVG